MDGYIEDDGYMQNEEVEINQTVEQIIETMRAHMPCDRLMANIGLDAPNWSENEMQQLEVAYPGYSFSITNLDDRYFLNAKRDK